MRPQKVFLTAEWTNLLMLNYVVDPSLLEHYVPPGTALDAFEGKTYLSLVGFEFNRSRLFGIPIPFHQAFEEVNLRFYVRRSSRQGVVFIRELVPKVSVAAVARLTFNENFSVVPMWHRIVPQSQTDLFEVNYGWGLGLNRCSMRIETEGPGLLPDEGSVSHFVTEHYWGYSAQPDGTSLEYEVEHPRWRVWNARSAELSGNLAGVYGDKIAQALAGKPNSAFLADGSPVTLFRGRRIS